MDDLGKKLDGINLTNEDAKRASFLLDELRAISDLDVRKIYRAWELYRFSTGEYASLVLNQILALFQEGGFLKSPIQKIEADVLELSGEVVLFEDK